MKIIVSLLMLAFLTSWCRADSPVDAELTKQIAQVLKEVSGLKAGSTRADLLEVFTTEGGVSGNRERIFVYRRCPYIKVDVTFTLTGSNQQTELPTDTIVKVSAPFLQTRIME